MKVVLEYDKDYSRLVENRGHFILDLTDKEYYGNHIVVTHLESFILYRNDDGSYLLKAKALQHKFICNDDGMDFGPKVLTEKDKSILQIPQRRVWEEPEMKGWWFWKKPTGKVLTMGSGYCILKERKDLCLRLDTLPILGAHFCDEIGETKEVI